MTRRPEFDDLVGDNVAAGERDRLRRAHYLLIEAGPPPELSPELEAVPWPEDALQPLFGRRREHKARRPVLLAAALATAIFVGFLLGQATTSDNSSVPVPHEGRCAARFVRDDQRLGCDVRSAVGRLRARALRP